MNKNLVKKLILYIADQLQDMGGYISTIRLIKILYLIDLEYYIRHGKTLTSINWVFYHYGPYFFEIGAVLRSSSIDLDDREVITSRGKGYTFKPLEEQDISNDVDFSTEQLINRILKKWGLEDTEALLNFVYATLPIKHGIRGQAIDFNHETDHLILQEARQKGDEFIPLDELLEKYKDDD